MSEILPIHYALSEAAIVAAGACAVVKAWPVNRWFSIGLALVAVAALIGTIRIILGLSGDIVALHEFLSRFGPMFGLGCIVGAMLMPAQMWPPFLGLAAATLGFLVPALATPLLGAAIIGGAMLAWRSTPDRRFLAAGSFAFLLCAALFSAPWRLAYPAVAWHVFHLTVATWFVLVAIFVPIAGAASGQVAKAVVQKS